jgi:hypothetical protein
MIYNMALAALFPKLLFQRDAVKGISALPKIKF